MTPLERAEKIVRTLNHFPGEPAVYIAAEIEAAVEEARQHEHDRIREQHAKDLIVATEAAVKEAREKLIDDIALCAVDDPIAKKLRAESFSQGAEFMKKAALRVIDLNGGHGGSAQPVSHYVLAKQISSLPTACCVCCPDGNPTKCNHGVACSKHGEAKPKSDSKAGEKA